MKTAFVFDVDGTLTPSRGKINEDFRLFMANFCEKYDCFVVTGSDQQKTIEQIGTYLYNKFQIQFQCNANQIFVDENTKVHESEWVLCDDAKDWLIRALESSKFELRTGKHIEERPGMVNFSIVGRNANLQERQEYVKWDQETKERENIAKRFNTIYNSRGIQAQVGGETGLDITPIGNDKRKAISWINELSRIQYDTFYFFGDACQEGGNDYPIAQTIIENACGFVYNVDNWKQTKEYLEEIDFALSSIH